MNFRFRNIIVAVAFGAAGLCALGLDLPVKRVAGTDYYFYTVGRNESLMDVAHKFGITRDDIVRNNPAASDGVKMGMTLYFPVYEFAENNTALPGQSEGMTGENAPTRYKVQKGETLYGIARRFEVSPDEIVAMNPEASSGVKPGMMLLIPHPGQMDQNVAHPASNPPTVPSVIPPDPVMERKLKPVDNAFELVDSAENESAVNDIPPVPELERRLKPVDMGPFELVEDSLDAETDTIEPAIALMLPLMLNDQADQKQGKLSADFIRGFMIGAKSMKDNAYPTTINIYDTEANPEKIAKILSEQHGLNDKVIIAHEEGPAGEVLPDFARENEVFVLNLFAAHDSAYLDNPFMLQANIPANLMYEKAAQALMSAYEGYRPVFLASKGGRGEKYPFVSYVKERYKEAGIQPMEFLYEGMLTTADVESLDLTKNYVFIPSSGSLSEFNKFANTLVSLRQFANDPSSIGLFGYPDWTTFRGESLDLLHRLGATIYSRYYCDDADHYTRMFNEVFENTYGYRPMEQVPSQALLGYDTARYLLTNLKTNDGEFVPAQGVPFRGIQSTFMFTDASDEDDSEAGYVNTSLYIITYLPGARVAVQVL